MPKTKEEFEQKIAAREAEVRSIGDEFNAKQAARNARLTREQEEWNIYCAQMQQKASHIEGMILQLREDMAAEEAPPEEPMIT